MIAVYISECLCNSCCVMTFKHVRVTGYEARRNGDGRTLVEEQNKNDPIDGANCCG